MGPSAPMLFANILAIETHYFARDALQCTRLSENTTRIPNGHGQWFLLVTNGSWSYSVVHNDYQHYGDQQFTCTKNISTSEYIIELDKNLKVNGKSFKCTKSPKIKELKVFNTYWKCPRHPQFWQPGLHSQDRTTAHTWSHSFFCCSVCTPLVGTLLCRGVPAVGLGPCSFVQQVPSQLHALCYNYRIFSRNVPYCVYVLLWAWFPVMSSMATGSTWLKHAFVGRDVSCKSSMFGPKSTTREVQGEQI